MVGVVRTGLGWRRWHRSAEPLAVAILRRQGQRASAL